MIDAITSQREDKKVRGNRILKNVEKQLATRHRNKLENFELDDDLLDTYKLAYKS